METFIILQKTQCVKQVGETIECADKYVSPGDIYEGSIIFRNTNYYIDLGYDRKLCYTILIPIFINNVDKFVNYNNKYNKNLKKNTKSKTK
jgi:hypothetical protein